jgi:hypothetical protein
MPGPESGTFGNTPPRFGGAAPEPVDRRLRDAASAHADADGPRRFYLFSLKAGAL